MKTPAERTRDKIKRKILTAYRLSDLRATWTAVQSEMSALPEPMKLELQAAKNMKKRKMS